MTRHCVGEGASARGTLIKIEDTQRLVKLGSWRHGLTFDLQAKEQSRKIGQRLAA